MGEQDIITNEQPKALGLKILAVCQSDWNDVGELVILKGLADLGCETCGLRADQAVIIPEILARQTFDFLLFFSSWADVNTLARVRIPKIIVCLRSLDSEIWLDRMDRLLRVIDLAFLSDRSYVEAHNQL